MCLRQSGGEGAGGVDLYWFQVQPSRKNPVADLIVVRFHIVRELRHCKGTYPSDPLSDPPPPTTSVYISLSYYRFTFISLFIHIFTLRSDPPSDPPCPIRRTLSHSCIHPPVHIQLSYDIYLYYFQNLLQSALEQGQYIFDS